MNIDNQSDQNTETSLNSQSVIYLRRCAVIAVCLLLMVGGFNIVIDPYLRFGSTRIERLNYVKPKAIRQVRMAKTYGVERGRFKTIFLGNSRVDVGLNPESDELPEQYKPAYNLGQPGTGTGVALQYLHHAMSTQSPTTVVLGVDFLNFIRTEKQLNQLQVENRTTVGPSNSAVVNRLSSINDSPSSWRQTIQRAYDMLSSAFSLSAFRDSIATVLAQRDPNSADMSANGFNSGAAFRTLIHVEGQASLFHQKNEEYVKKCLNRRAPPFEQSEELLSIEALLKYCQIHGIRVEVYIHPYHADMLEIFDATDHWDDLEQWKTQLVSICESHDARLWDFSGYNRYTTELPPAVDDHETVMQWYWESGHYRSSLGDQMLSQMFDTSPIDIDVGRQLSMKMLPDWFANSRAAGKHYRESHPVASARVRALIPPGLDRQVDNLSLPR